jgi:hypothetical protein
MEENKTQMSNTNCGQEKSILLSDELDVLNKSPGVVRKAEYNRL